MNDSFTWIVGPCAIESENQYFEIAEKLLTIMNKRSWYYKASFDKANRTSINGNRGVGLQKGIELFCKIKDKFPEIKLTTDIYLPDQASIIFRLVDVFQIPSFLCKQTDLLVEAGKYGKIVNVKKGQWMTPRNCIGIVDKVKYENNNCEVWLTERGATFGYSGLIVDFSNVDFYKKVFDKIILDCTNTTQFISSDGFTKGNSELARRYLFAASIFNYSGLFAEVYLNPKDTISDSTCQIKFDEFFGLVEYVEMVLEIVRQAELRIRDTRTRSQNPI